MIAAGQMPRHERSAVKKKPRKKNSSTSGAPTQTRNATLISATLLSSTPSDFGSSSSVLSAPIRLTHAAVTTRKATQVSRLQPSARQNGVGRRPKSAGRGVPAIRAKKIAAPTRQTSWTTSERMFTDAGGSSKLAPAAAAPMAMKSAPTTAAAKPATSAANDIHAFHCGPAGVRRHARRAAPGAAAAAGCCGTVGYPGGAVLTGRCIGRWTLAVELRGT